MSSHLSSLSATRPRLSSEEIGCLMSILSQGLRPVGGKRRSASSSSGGGGARTAASSKQQPLQFDIENAAATQPSAAAAAAPALPLQSNRPTSSSGSNPHAHVAKKYAVAVDAVECARAVEDERHAALYLVPSISTSMTTNNGPSSSRDGKRRPYTAGTLRHTTPAAARPSSSSSSPLASPKAANAATRGTSPSMPPPSIIGQSIHNINAPHPQQQQSTTCKPANRPSTAPVKATATRPTSSGAQRPLSSKRSTAPTARYQGIVDAVIYQEKAARERDDEDMDAGIIEDDGDNDGEEDARLEDLMHHHRGGATSRGTSARARPPLSASASGRTLPPSRPTTATNFSARGAEPQSHSTEQQQVRNNGGDDDHLHVLGTASPAHVRGDAPPPTYFGLFRFHNITDFLQHQKKETFGRYYENVSNYMAARGVVKGGAAATSSRGSSLPPPKVFCDAVDAEFRRQEEETINLRSAAGPSTEGEQTAEEQMRRSASVVAALRRRRLQQQAADAADNKAVDSPTKRNGHRRQPLRGANYSAVKVTMNRW